MMTVRNCIGRYALNINRLAILLIATSFTGSALAAPVESLTPAGADALATAESAWADSLLGAQDNSAPYDEQIFTDLSPILDSPEGVKLPEDQLLTD